IKLSVVEDLEELGRAFKNKDLSARRYACITVQDDGRGIPPEIIERVFEAYFSTKDDRGTGLGLSTVDSIVRFYGGAVVLASQVNVGTTVSVYLPLVDLQKLSFKPALKPKQKKEVQGGTERILIVDDEYPVRNVLNVSLRHLGYHVDLAASGREAIATFCERVDGYDLVILDILMPQLSGEETFLELKHLAPTVKVLLMSGYSSPEVVKRLLQKGAGGFMQKPFTIDQLASKVRECLDSKDSGNN
ncbi:MAG: response regulator, partial [Bdellovibrionales bacterium]|nr:response regulator [Bdellovibrionales bacterium]